MTRCSSLLLFVFLQTAAHAGEPTIQRAEEDEHGFQVHTVECEYQSGKTKIKVLPPENVRRDERYPVLYVLPVEAGDTARWGDALREVQKHELHNKHQLICVCPTFSHLPWYADHPSDRQIRQESYFVNVVVPFVERAYPARTDRDGRLLIGFSKSGWGAFSLLLRHPDKFGKAAAWDAPLMKQQPNQFGMGPIFGTQENFEQYRISSLFRRQADRFRDQPRLIHMGYDAFRQHHLEAEDLLDELKVAHVFRDGPQRKHAWSSGWLPEAVELLTTPSRKNQ